VAVFLDDDCPRWQLSWVAIVQVAVGLMALGMTQPGLE